MNDGHSDYLSAGRVIMCGVIILVILLFLPLVLSFVEFELFHTHKVEDFFRQIGLFDALAKLYRPIVKLFSP